MLHSEAFSVQKSLMMFLMAFCLSCSPSLPPSPLNLCNFSLSHIKISFISDLIRKVADIHRGEIVVGQPQVSCCGSSFFPKLIIFPRTLKWEPSHLLVCLVSTSFLEEGLYIGEHSMRKVTALHACKSCGSLELFFCVDQWPWPITTLLLANSVWLFL